MCDEKSEIIKEGISWENHHEGIFIDWADKAACYKWLHERSHLKYHKKRNFYTIPVIIFSTLTGTANFALERIPKDYQSTVTLVIGSLNIITGIITTISQFLKLNELTESYRVASISWDKFHRSVRLELIKAPEERVDVSYFMKINRDEFDRLMETCPSIDNDVLESFKKSLTSGKDKKEIDRKLRIFNKLTKPEIFNEIQPLEDVIFKRRELENISTEEIIKLRSLTAEREKYQENLDRVKTFVYNFDSKYSRRPSIQEINSNVSDINHLDLNIIVDDLKKTNQL